MLSLRVMQRVTLVGDQIFMGAVLHHMQLPEDV
jgi:hypothetical protein